jgi:transposase
MRQSRWHFSASQKAQIVRRHISGKKSVSNLADKFSLQTSQIHTWVKHVLDQAERALERSAGRASRAERLQAKLVEQLQSRLVEKNEVIAELMQEHVQLEKNFWSPERSLGSP